MLPGSIVAGVLLLYLALFFAVNLQNVIQGCRVRRGENAYAEVNRPRGLLMCLAALGTLAFFAEALLAVYAGFTGQIYLLVSALQLEFPCASSLQVLGLTVMGAGFLVFIWSVVARGRHSVSWEICPTTTLSSPRDHTGTSATPHTSGTSSCSQDSS